MLGFYLQGFDLNKANTTYLDITLKQQFFSTSFNLINQTDIPLVPCTEAHFSHQAAEESRLFDRIDVT